MKANVNPPDSELSRLKDTNKNWKKVMYLNSEQGVTHRRNGLHYNGDLDTSSRCPFIATMPQQTTVSLVQLKPQR